jgi:hypothetical protein
VFADPIGVVVDLIIGREPSLDRGTITGIVERVAGGRAKRRRLAQALLDRPGVLDDGRSPAPRAVGDLLITLNRAGATHISPPMCAEWQTPAYAATPRDDWYCRSAVGPRTVRRVRTIRRSARGIASENHAVSRIRPTAVVTACSSRST